MGYWKQYSYYKGKKNRRLKVSDENKLGSHMVFCYLNSLQEIDTEDCPYFLGLFPEFPINCCS